MKRPWEILLRMPKFAGFIVKKPKLATNILKHLANEKFTDKPMIRAIEYGVTYNCQASCDKCSAAFMKDDSKSKLSMEQIRQLGDDCYKLGNYEANFTGGEPLLEKNLEEIISYFHPESTFIGINTNGALLDRKRILSLKEAGADVLKISIDSPDPKEHDKCRGIEGLFNHIVEVLEITREIPGIRAHICVVTTKELLSSGKAAKLVEFAKIHEATLGIVLPAATGKWIKKHEVLIDGNDRAVLENLGKDKDVFLQGNIGNSRFVCPCGTTEIYITCYGEIIPCPFIQISFGNVNDESFKNIYYRMAGWKGRVHNAPVCASAEDPEFRKKYIDPISEFKHNPVPFEKLPPWKKPEEDR